MGPCILEGGGQGDRAIDEGCSLPAHILSTICSSRAPSCCLPISSLRCSPCVLPQCHPTKDSMLCFFLLPILVLFASHELASSSDIVTVQTVAYRRSRSSTMLTWTTDIMTRGNRGQSLAQTSSFFAPLLTWDAAYLFAPTCSRPCEQVPSPSLVPFRHRLVIARWGIPERLPPCLIRSPTRVCTW
jgi:hypothetical protein